MVSAWSNCSITCWLREPAIGLTPRITLAVRILIVFPDEWLAYAPTVINLFELLNRSNRVRIVAICTGKYRRLRHDAVHYIGVNIVLARILAAFRLYKPFKALLLRARIRKEQPDEIIAVDSVAAWAAQSAGYRFHFLSLEVARDWFFRRLRHERIASVLSQTSERYEYLFGDADLKTYYLQNAPTFRPLRSKNPKPDTLVFLGNAIPSHGVYHCAEFVAKATRWSLTVKGNIPAKVRKHLERRYAELIREGRLILDDSYLSEEDVVGYLSSFYAGFCLYDLSLIDADDFNYISCPSGKLFRYYAAGVPVVASNLLGLRSVEIFRTGVQVESPDADSIRKALEQIEGRHDEYVANCLRAAEHFSFAERAADFVNVFTREPVPSNSSPEKPRTEEPGPR